MAQYFQLVREIWREKWEIRWIVANSLGWSIGLLAAALLVRILGWFGAIFAGALLAGLASAAQSFVLLPPDLDRRRWIALSAAGGLLITLPVYLLGLLALLYLPLGLLLMGALFGAATGAGQARLLRRSGNQQARLWIAACALAGSLCAPLTLSASSFGLPVVCAPGPLLFGIVTAWALPRILSTSDSV